MRNNPRRVRGNAPAVDGPETGAAACGGRRGESDQGGSQRGPATADRESVAGGVVRRVGHPGGGPRWARHPAQPCWRQPRCGGGPGLSELASGVRQAEDEADPERGRVVLAFLYTLGERRVPALLRAFRERTRTSGSLCCKVPTRSCSTTFAPGERTWR